MPYGFMAAITQIGLRDEVAIRQQDWKLRFVCANRDAIDGKHIRTIREVGDAAETFGFALGTEGSVGDVEPFQRKVTAGVEARNDRQRTGIARVCERTRMDHHATRFNPVIRNR